jgi:outer membrane protein assembly factor BamB
MRRYIDEPSVSIGSEFGHVDIVRIIEGAKESMTPQYFGARKGGSIFSNLEVRGGLLLFGASDGNFYAVDAVSGNEVWRYPAGDIVLSFDMGRDAIYISCYDHCVHAVGFDGRLLWKFRADGKPGGMTFKSGRIYFGTESGTFYCVDTKGRLVWKFATDSHIGAIPKVGRGVVLFGDFHGRLYALEADTGRRLWVFKGSLGMGGCTVLGDTIFMPTRSGRFYAIGFDGRERWSLNFSRGLAVDMYYKPEHGTVFASDFDACLHAIDAETGKIRWTFRAPEVVNIFLVFGEGSVYVSDYFRNVYSLDFRTGRVNWSFKTGGPNAGGIALHDGRVYAGSWDCNAYCLDAKSGGLIWKFRTSMAAMSDWILDHQLDREENTFTVSLTREETEEIRKEEPAFSDYGEFSGSYMSKDKADYVSSGKRSYVKKREF